MFEPTEHKLDNDLSDSMRIFQRSQIGPVSPLEPRSPKHLLLALDGSEQDALGIALSRSLRERLQCAISVLDARETIGESNLARGIAEELGGEAIPEQEGDSYEQILNAAEICKCDMIVVPCPFGRNLEKVGPDSVGTVIDVLLNRSPVPLLVVRKPYELVTPPFDHALLVIVTENETEVPAAAFAAGLLTPGGSFEMLLLLEHEMVENFNKLMEAMEPDAEYTEEQLTAALQQSHIRLHRSLQQSQETHDFQYQTHVYRADEPVVDKLLGDAAHPLIAVGLERKDHTSIGHVQQRIRQSIQPVLVVFGSVPTVE